MLKKLLLFTFLLSVGCFASGKLTVQPTYWLDSKVIRPQVGLSVYQPLVSKWIAYNSWIGMGDNPTGYEGDSVLWMSAKQDVDFHFGNLTLSPGWYGAYSLPSKELHHNVHVKIAVELW